MVAFACSLSFCHNFSFMNLPYSIVLVMILCSYLSLHTKFSMHTYVASIYFYIISVYVVSKLCTFIVMNLRFCLIISLHMYVKVYT
ncbi:hypothetical protein AXX17_AT5G10610 [Arabidopsis thaliana]|uniref:Uncharacterized protein n=1 Tax=Arabidopsis thaliana TaxID=3702 RepID=A0A178U9D9_ARATH|nr:hypothetical protein AXX17_AT5G10610 [Arabidopsis thaliana]